MTESDERRLIGAEQKELLALSAMLTDDLLNLQDAPEPELKPHQVQALEREKGRAQQLLFKEKVDRQQLLRELKEVRVSIYALKHLNSLAAVQEHTLRQAVLAFQQRLQEAKYERLQAKLLLLDHQLSKAKVTLAYCEERLKKGENTPRENG